MKITKTMEHPSISETLAALGVQEKSAGAATGQKSMETHGASKLHSDSPVDGKRIASVYPATAETYEQVMQTAAAAFLRWRAVPAPARGEIVRQIGQQLREYKEFLGRLVSYEMGKIRAEGLRRSSGDDRCLRFAAGFRDNFVGSRCFRRPGHRMNEQWHPWASIGMITAFNFPVAVWSWNAPIAAVCGDPVVWKPACPTSTLTPVAVQHIANRVMGLISHRYARRDFQSCHRFREAAIGDRMLGDRRLALISFTGSTQIGQHVAEVVARRFGRTILELGGNNAIIRHRGSKPRL